MCKYRSLSPQTVERYHVHEGVNGNVNEWLIVASNLTCRPFVEAGPHVSSDLYHFIYLLVLSDEYVPEHIWIYI